MAGTYYPTKVTTEERAQNNIGNPKKRKEEGSESNEESKEEREEEEAEKVGQFPKGHSWIGPCDFRALSVAWR